MLFSFLYFLFLVTFLLYVTFFFSLFLFVVLFLLYSFFISLKILHFIPFRVYYILLKQKSKQNPSKMPSKYLSKTENRVANVADIILSYTLIGYIFAVFSFACVLLQLLLKQNIKQNASKVPSKKKVYSVLTKFFLHKVRLTTYQLAFLVSYMISKSDVCPKQVFLNILQITLQQINDGFFIYPIF